MIHFTTKYVSRVPSVKAEAEARADALVKWGAVALQGMVRLKILSWPGGPIVDTGNMLGSVSVTFLGAKRAMVFVGADYAHFVNNGTSRMAARPFFDQAVNDFIPQFRGAVKAL